MVMNKVDFRQMPNAHCKRCIGRWFLNLLSALLLVFSSWVQAGVSIYPKSVTLGEPVTLVLSGKDIDADFEKIDKNLIRNSFEIYDVDGYSDRLRLTLYPRKPGVARFPELRSGTIQFPGAKIEVKENDAVHIEWKRPQAKGWVQHFRPWLAEVSLSRAADRAELKLHPHANAKVEKQWQGTAVSVERNVFGRTETFLLAVTHSQPGDVSIRSPMIEVRHTGPRPWRFFDQTQTLTFKALPSYLPAFFPVGDLDVSASFSNRLVSTGALHLWRLNVTGTNVLPSTLPDLTSNLHSGHDILWLSSEKTRSTHMTREGIHTSLSFVQPVRFECSGLYALPALTVTYFDANTGKLADKTLPAHWVGAFPVWLNGLFYLFVTLIGLGLVWVVWHGSRQLFAKWRLVKDLNQARSESDVWNALNTWSQSHLNASFDNRTHGQWLNAMETTFGKNGRLMASAYELTKRLDQSCFAFASGTQTPGSDQALWKSAANDFARFTPYFCLRTFINTHQLRLWVRRMGWVR